MLVIDSEPVFAVGAVAVLQRAGLVVRPVDPGEAAVPTEPPEGVAGGAQPPPTEPGAPAPVLLLDSALAGGPGLAALVHGALARWSAASVVLILRREQQEGLLGLLGEGVLALLHRRCSPQELVTAVQAAAGGRTWVAPALAGTVRAESMAERSGNRSAVLSARELDVLRRMATGATNAAIGRSLGISDNTVRNHVHAILAKLGAANRTDAVALAARRGIVEISD